MGFVVEMIVASIVFPDNFRWLVICKLSATAANVVRLTNIPAIPVCYNFEWRYLYERIVHG